MKHVASSFSLEIQGLRALAVAAVLLTHVGIGWLPGGFVGVDVFFVISGYLITGMLLREQEKIGGIIFSDFYARRIRRLLPAATLVLLTVVLCVNYLPGLAREDTLKEVVASTSYVQNWWLAARAVDYLAAENSPGPLQHFWSLSVEEQYYIFWPLLLAPLVLISKARERSVRCVYQILCVGIAIGSFCYCVYVTNVEPGLAYFSTASRAWELAVGGMLACCGFWRGWGPVWRALVGWVGLVFIVGSVFLIDASSVFPGWIAIFPVFGSAMLICAGEAGGSMGPGAILRLRPMQFLGDISYSLYLWHWPVIIFFTSITGRNLEGADTVVVTGVSIALAFATKLLVEDPARNASWLRGNFRIFLFGFMISAVTISMAFLAISYFGERTSLAENVIADNSNDVRKELVEKISPESLRPKPHEARADNASVYVRGCHVDQRSAVPIPCVYGIASAQRKIVLVGDSHAAQWVPAFEEILGDEFQLVSHTKSACAFTDQRLLLGAKGITYSSCYDWSQSVMQSLLIERPEAVFISQSRAHHAEGATDGNNAELLAAGSDRMLRRLRQAGIRVVVVGDTPRIGLNVPECLSRRGSSVAGCSRPSAAILARVDPIRIAAERAGVEMIEFDRRICPQDTCPAASGDVLIWRDAHHLTATFARQFSRDFSSLLAREEVDERAFKRPR